MNKVFTSFIILLSVLFSVSAKIKGALDKEWFIRLNENDISGPSVTIDGNSYSMSKEAASVFELIELQGHCGYNFINGKLSFAKNKYYFSLTYYEYFKGTEYSLSVEELIVKNRHQSYYLIAKDDLPNIQTQYKKYSAYLKKQEEEKQKQLVREKEHDDIVNKFGKLTTTTISLGGIKSDGGTIDMKYYADYRSDDYSRIFIDKAFCFRDLLFYLTNDSDILILYKKDSYDGQKIFREYLDKFLKWYKEAKKDKLQINKKIGDIKSCLLWTVNSKKQIDALNTITLNFVTTNDNKYKLTINTAIAHSTSNYGDNHSIKPIIFSYDAVVKLRSLIDEKSIDNAINKQIEIDKRFQ